MHDNGNLNYQQGNSHQTAQGDLHNSKRQQRLLLAPPAYPYPQPQQGYGHLVHPYPYPSWPAYSPPVYPSPYGNGYQLQFNSQFQGPQWLQPGPLSPHRLNPPHPPPVASYQHQQSHLMSHLAYNPQLAKQVQDTTKKIEMLIRQAQHSGKEEEVGERLQQFANSGGSEETLDKLLELAKDPLYDPSLDPEFDPLEGSPNYQNLPFYTEDPAHHDVKLNPVSTFGSFSARFSRKRRGVPGGKHFSLIDLLSRS